MRHFVITFVIYNNLQPLPSQYYWFLNRKIETRNDRVNYLKKILAACKKGNQKGNQKGKPPVAGGVSFHGHNKNKITNKQANN